MENLQITINIELINHLRKNSLTIENYILLLLIENEELFNNYIEDSPNVISSIATTNISNLWRRGFIETDSSDSDMEWKLTLKGECAIHWKLVDLTEEINKIKEITKNIK